MPSPTTNPTVRSLILGAMRLINVVGANEVPTEGDMQIAVDSLNGMIDSWSNNRLMIYSITPYEFLLTGPIRDYTLGPGGDWDVERPMAIEQAYARLNSGTAQQLDISMESLTDAQYASIAVKNTTSTFPFAFYDNGNYPLRTVSLFPIPNGSNCTIVLWLRQPLLDLTSLDQQVSYPPGYERAYRFNLAVELADEFGKVVSDNTKAIATASKLELERLNSTPMYLRGDGGMSRNGRGKYFNWITGDFWRFGN